MTLKYVSALIAIMIFGSTADVPVMFLGVRGELSLYFVFIAGFSVDILSDIFWYWLGHKIGVERFEHLRFFKQNPQRMAKVGHALDKYGMFMLFFSKFTYLLGIPTQIVAGAHKYPFKKMFWANILGNSALLLAVYGLAKIFASEIVVERYLKDVKIAFIVFFIVLATLNFGLKKIFDKFFSD